jgi:hypothetical protein
MATYTSTVFSAQPKAFMDGRLNSVGGSITLPAASSVGDVVFLCRIPHGAQVIDFWEDHTTGATAQGLDFGFAKGGAAGGAASLSALISGGAQATKNRLNVLGRVAAVSVSDNDPQRWGILAAKVASGSATTSLKVNFSVLYRTDDG